MLLTITTTHRPATDLGHLLHKHPERVQSFGVPFGRAHVFYPEAGDERCTAALLLDVDPVGLVRRGGGRSAFALAEYVNDRPYVASSFLSVAMNAVYKSAMAGTCVARPELAQTPIPLEARLPAAPARGGEPLVRRVFEPLGYELDIEPVSVRHVALRLSATVRLADLLNHLYVLLPVLDDDKHYWVGDDEVAKLLRKGEGWLPGHPDRALIARRYLKRQARLFHPALAQLDELAPAGEDPEQPAPEEQLEERISLRDERLGSVQAVLKAAGARRNLDLGCGAGAATHLFRFAGFVEEFRGWGRALRRAVGGWYTAKAPDRLAYQAVKYRSRDGYTHRDLLRLAHPGRAVSAGNPALEVTDAHAALFEWIARGTPAPSLPRIVEGFARAQAAAGAPEAAAVVREYGLPREAVRPEHLGSRDVWEALLEDMPMTALIRNLATMSRAGVLEPGSDATARVTAQLGDAERLRRARVHPIAVLAALCTYASGRGARGSGRWDPVREVVDALDAAFYAAFGNVEPTDGRTLLALDVSGSMCDGQVAGVPGLTPRVAAAAMALVTAATEQRYEIVAFHDGLSPLAISPRQRLDDVVAATDRLPFGGTDCALPMLYAQAKGREVDTFVVYTDSETWAGDVHPVQALRDYRRASGIAARLVVVGMVSNGFSIADPDDAGMLDVVGFDTATPQLIADFARGAL